MLEIEPLRASRATVDRNWSKSDTHGRCLLCDAPINPTTSIPFYVHHGGFAIVTPAEYAVAEQTDLGAGLGTQYIGRECYQKHKDALLPYRLEEGGRVMTYTKQQERMQELVDHAIMLSNSLRNDLSQLLDLVPVAADSTDQDDIRQASKRLDDIDSVLEYVNDGRE